MRAYALVCKGFACELDEVRTERTPSGLTSILTTLLAYLICARRYTEDKVFVMPEPSWGMDDQYLVSGLPPGAAAGV